VKRLFLDNLELWLSAAGILVTFAIPLLFPNSFEFWQVAAFSAVGVATLHGVIFWLVRRRQRVVRARAIAEIRAMMQDVVKNQMAIFSLVADTSAAEDAELLGESMDTISHLIDTLGEESLVTWKGRYESATVDKVVTGNWAAA
jgi:hypothetical protein